MCYVSVPVGNMLLERVMKLGDAFLFPSYGLEDCGVSGNVSHQELEWLRAVYGENRAYYDLLAEETLCTLLFRAQEPAQRIQEDPLVKSRILYRANRYLDYLILTQCRYDRPEYLVNAAGQVGERLFFDLLDEKGKLCAHVDAGSKYYSTQPGLGLDVGDLGEVSEDGLYPALFSQREDEVYQEYRAVLGHVCDAMRIGDRNRCFSCLFTQMERIGRCDGYHFQRNKVRVLSCLAKDQETFDILSGQLYFYAREIRTDIIHRGKNVLDQFPLGAGNGILNDLLSMIVRFCLEIIRTGIDSFSALDAYLTEQEGKYTYERPRETEALTPKAAQAGTGHVYAACVANLDLKTPVKLGNVIFLPDLRVFPLNRYYRNYVIKDWGREDYDQEFEGFSVGELEMILEIMKHREAQGTPMAILFGQPWLPEWAESSAGCAFLCDHICKEIEKRMGYFLLISDDWKPGGVLPSRVGIWQQIRMVFRYEEQWGELEPIPGNVYPGYFEPPVKFEIPEGEGFLGAVIHAVFSAGEPDEVKELCAAALQRVCEGYYMEDLNLRILFLFDTLDMLHPDTTSGEELRKRVLAFACGTREEYAAQTEDFRRKRETIRNPILHGGKSVFDLVDRTGQVYEICEALEGWILSFCISVTSLGIQTQEELKQISTQRRKLFS